MQQQSIAIDTVNNYDMLANMLLQSTVNASERTGLMAMGCDNDSCTGLDLPWTNVADGSTHYMTFCIPLINLLGLSSSDQMLPIGSIGNLQLVLKQLL